MNVDSWRVFYTNDRHYNSRDHDWRRLPRAGVLLLILYYDEWASETVRYRKILDGEDYYWHDPDTGMFGSSMSHPSFDESYVKLGTEINDEDFYAVKAEALEQTWQ